MTPQLRRVTDQIQEPPEKPSLSTVKFYIISAIVLSIFTAACAVALAIFAPANTTTMTIIIGFTLPTITALIGAGLYGTVTHINGRMTQLIQTTAQKERLQGVLEGLKENPNTNIQ